jgi:glycosyltransferase involved in cell wall biosynthesis
MSNTPLVSCIIAFFNAEKFLEEAINSVLTQHFTDWELLLVDDGSSDSSTLLARSYVAHYPDKLRYLEHPDHQNRGVCAARNRGVHEARGKYLAFLDADDIWLPEKLAEQVALIEAYPEAGLVYGASQYWRSWDTTPRKALSDFTPGMGVTPDQLYQPPELARLVYPLGKALSPCPSDLFVRRELVLEIGGFEEDFHGPYQLYEDQAFLTKIFLKAPVYIANRCWDRYRLHPDSCDVRVLKAGQYRAVRLYYLEWLSEYLVTHNIDDQEIWQLLQKAFWPYRHPWLNHSVRFSRLVFLILERIRRKVSLGAKSREMV